VGIDQRSSADDHDHDHHDDHLTADDDDRTADHDDDRTAEAATRQEGALTGWLTCRGSRPTGSNAAAAGYPSLSKLRTRRFPEARDGRRVGRCRHHCSERRR
jgi:hypothetical protein